MPQLLNTGRNKLKTESKPKTNWEILPLTMKTQSQIQSTKWQIIAQNK